MKLSKIPIYLRWGLGIFMILVLLVVAFFIYNQFDEELDPATKAWLDYQTPTVAAKDNAYLALYSLESEVPDRLAVVASSIARLQHIAHSGVLANHQQEYQQVLAALKIQQRSFAELDSICPKGKPCLIMLKEQQNHLSQLRQEYAELLMRYSAMLAMPAFKELLIRDAEAPLPLFSPATQAGYFIYRRSRSSLKQSNTVLLWNIG